MVIIDIDEQSIKQEGRWPWPRDKLASLVENLSDYGVITIAFDVVMPDSESNNAIELKNKIEKLQVKNTPPGLGQFLLNISSRVDNDLIFAKVLENTNPILGFLFHYYDDVQKGLLPQPELSKEGKPLSASHYHLVQFKGYSGSYELFTKASGKGGFVTNIPDSDGVIRRSLLLADFDNKIYSSLALQTAKSYLLSDLLTLKTKKVGDKLDITNIDLEGVNIPLDKNAQIMIPYYGEPGTLDYYSASDILQKKIDPHNLDGTIAVIGSSMILLSDLHETPFSPVFPGVEIVGNIITGVISGHITLYHDWDSLGGMLSLLMFGFLLSVLCSYLKITYKLLMMIVFTISALGLTYFLYLIKNIFISPALILMLILIIFLTNYAYVFYLERKQKSQINDLFGQYIPKDYVEVLMQNPGSSSMEGETREMTVFFADIRSFTTISESLDASDVKKLLNTFFTPLTEIIFKHKGTIDKYVGDMVVAFWGAPIIDNNHSKHAIEASLEIFDKMDEINAALIKEELPSVNIGVGIGTGNMSVGDMGSKFRRSYTVLGDIVNISSRLQDLTKFYKVNILVTEMTKESNDHILWRLIDKVAVKGRASAISIYEPICYRSLASSELLDEMNLHDDAISLYFSKDFENARSAFAKLSKEYPSVYIYSLYLKRSIEFIKSPPPADWDGIFIHTTK